MTIYAVMRTGGKEYRVAPGDVVRVEKLGAAPGATVEIREVCSIAIGQEVTVGSPTVADARVVAEVLEEGRGERIVSFKKKRRNHYQMTMEDLKSYTVLRIREIAVGQCVYDAAATVMPPRDLAATTPPPTAAPNDAPVVPKVASEERVDTQAQGAQPSSDAVHRMHPLELPPSAPASAPPARTELPPPSSDEVHSVRAMEPLPSIPPPTKTPPSREPRTRSHGIAALVVALLVMAGGLLLWGGGQPRGPVAVATTVAAPQAAQPSVPQPVAKAPPGKEAAIKNPAAASAPSAPVQPPE
jgi:large subunit ribosomal protein L21